MNGITYSLTSYNEIIILDTRYFIAITHDINDFLNIKYAFKDCLIKQIVSKLQVHGIREVHWNIFEISNQPVTFSLQYLYVPKASCRLLPPQQLNKILIYLNSTRMKIELEAIVLTPKFFTMDISLVSLLI